MAQDGTAETATEASALSLADVTEAARTSAETPHDGTSLQDVVVALGQGEGAAILAGASFLWDPAVAPRVLDVDAVRPVPEPASEAQAESEAEVAAGGSGWSIESVISWAQSTVLFGDWLPSADLGSDRSIAVAARASEEPEAPQADLEQTDDEGGADRPAESQPTVTLTDVVDAVRPEDSSLGDLSAVAALLRSSAVEIGQAQETPEQKIPEQEIPLEEVVTAALSSEPAAVPEPVVAPTMRITKVVPEAPTGLQFDVETVPTLDKVAAAPPVGLRYDGFTRALEQPGTVGLRLPKPVRRPFSAADLGIDVTPGSSADSLAHMLQRVGTETAYVGQSTKAIAFNDVVDNAAGVRTVRGLYKIQRKKAAQARRSELVDALRDAVPSDNASLKY